MANSSIFAFADNTTAGYRYYEAGSTLNPYTAQSGLNSADMMGYVLRVLSLNQSRIYDRLSNLSGGGADLTTVNSYITSIDSKLGVIRDSLGIGSSLENVLSNQTSNLQHLNTIINKLSYWDNSHGRSYDVSEMIYNVMNYNNDIVENTSSVPAIYNILNTLPKSFNFVHPSRSSVTGTASMTVNHTPTYMSWFGTPESRVYTWVADTTVSSTFDYLGVINNNLNFLGSALYTINTSYQSDRYDGRGTVAGYAKVYSVLDVLIFGFNDLNKMIDKLSFVLADDETIVAKRANASQTTAVLSNYTGNGSASATASDFGDIKDSVGSVKSGLNTNVSVSNIFNIFNNNDGYGFWSDDTRQELNSTGSNRTNYKARGVSDTPLYDAKIDELYKAMGVKHE